MPGPRKLATNVYFKRLALPLIILAIALIALFFVLEGKITIPSLQPTTPDRTAEELKSIAETSPAVKDYGNVAPIYRKYPDPNSNVYIVDYIDKGTNSGISLYIDLNTKEIVKTQVVVGIN